MSYLFNETFSIGFNAFLLFLIKYLKDDDAPLKEGLICLVVLSFLVCAATFLRNMFFHAGYIWAI